MSENLICDVCGNEIDRDKTESYDIGGTRVCDDCVYYNEDEVIDILSRNIKAFELHEVSYTDYYISDEYHGSSENTTLSEIMDNLVDGGYIFKNEKGESKQNE